jgi:hypothetical protein
MRRIRDLVETSVFNRELLNTWFEGLAASNIFGCLDRGNSLDGVRNGGKQRAIGMAEWRSTPTKCRPKRRREYRHQPEHLSDGSLLKDKESAKQNVGYAVVSYHRGRERITRVGPMGSKSEVCTTPR